MSVEIGKVKKILGGLASTRTEREELYKHFHQHPELSMQEHATAERIVKELESSGIRVTRVGETGVVAVVDNGEGPVVAMRADIDALPVKEASGKDYASTATQVDAKTGVEVPVAHACGHDVHLMSLLTALQAFNEHKDQWSGTFIGVFQPAEETAEGARAMLAAGLEEAMPRPDVYLGQHVLASLPGGHVGTRRGPVLSSAFSVKVTVHGKGSHGSMPELGVDPVVLASSIVMRLQTIVSREVAAKETAVVTVGAIHAGTKSNIITDSAELLINTRAYSSEVSEHLKEAIERIVRAECVAARSPKEPEFTYYDRYPLTDNDGDATDTVREAFDAYFGDESCDLDAVPASEDFSIIPDALGVPYTYWGLGGFADMSKAVGNHNPAFAPDLQPTLDRGAEAVVVAASAWLTVPVSAD
ncbi:amidohydrolase [Corynebacterium sp. HMSC034B08]|uniref:amidohydrolase n=1 Tax=Corynebacterium sp. HMSC034B08 TaxID=1715135 RepID=UPI0008A8EC44|nr:amidohydrolase [Corynebacterium sp. HMSC034B08]OHO27282.1 amidohydrolase [Corynebacterium sp. HMSC034B08]